jgi:hypothetical protein
MTTDGSHAEGGARVSKHVIVAILRDAALCAAPQDEAAERQGCAFVSIAVGTALRAFAHPTR